MKNKVLNQRITEITTETLNNQNIKYRISNRNETLIISFYIPISNRKSVMVSIIKSELCDVVSICAFGLFRNIPIDKRAECIKHCNDINSISRRLCSTFFVDEDNDVNLAVNMPALKSRKYLNTAIPLMLTGTREMLEEYYKSFEEILRIDENDKDIFSLLD